MRTNQYKIKVIYIQVTEIYTILVVNSFKTNLSKALNQIDQ